MSLKSKPLEHVRSIKAVAEMAVEDVVRVNLNVPKSLRNQWKKAALEHDKTVTELIMEAMLQYSGEQVSK